MRDKRLIIRAVAVFILIIGLTTIVIIQFKLMSLSMFYSLF